MKLANLDFNKPIYAHLEDGVHEVRFDLFDVFFYNGNYCGKCARVRMRIAGMPTLKQKKIALTNDLDDAILNPEMSKNIDKFIFLEHNFGNENYYVNTTYLEDLMQFADFGFTRFKTSAHPEAEFYRWKWNGFKPEPAKIVSVGKRHNDSKVLVFNAIKKEFYPIEGGTFATKEECAEANHIKVFTFED